MCKVNENRPLVELLQVAVERSVMSVSSCAKYKLELSERLGNSSRKVNTSYISNALYRRLDSELGEDCVWKYSY